MSDQGYTQQNEQEEDTGLFCRNCSPVTRKIGYYLTFIAGVILFIIGLVLMFTASVALLIIGGLLVVLSPLWIKSPKNLCIALKNPLRLTSTILFLGFLIATIIAALVIKKDALTIVLGIFLGLSGIWYFLSFFQNGQEACWAFLKTCCCKKKEEQGETVQESA